MNSYKKPNKNRLLAVFNKEMPDRVPNFEVLISNPTLKYILGKDLTEQGYLHTLDNIPPLDYIELVTRVGQDVIGTCFYDCPFKCMDENGNEVPLQIKSRRDLDRLLPINLEHLESTFALMDAYQEAVKGTDIGLFSLAGSPLTYTYDTIFGFENFMYTLYDDYDLVEEVLEIMTQHCVKISERLAEYDLTFYYFGDDIAYKGGLLFNPEAMRKLWLPRMARIIEPFIKKRTPVMFHSDGNIMEIISDLIEIGIAALNPIEPYGMDIREIKKKFGKNIALVGNLDVGGNLSRGTPEDVKKEAEALIDDVGRDGGLVLASCHSITSNVKPENFIAMVETAQTYGIYK
ncbi:MAG TPA: hypothetical protein GXX14_00115 [Clostridiaceae bacterium]|nr:hypothetical protein [Clostridiaceae bacterium]